MAALRRDRERLRRAREEMTYGKLSGAVGTHANVPADIEEAVCARLGLHAEPVVRSLTEAGFLKLFREEEFNLESAFMMLTKGLGQKI